MKLEEKKKLLYRSKHRGCKEMDILLGNFAAEFLFSLSDEDLNQYKIIIDMDDQLIYSYFTGQEIVPKDLPLLNRIVSIL
jgi:antitoxin CptB